MSTETTRPSTMVLPVKLTAEERRDIAVNASHLWAAIDEEEAKARATFREAMAMVKASRRGLLEMRASIETGIAHRPIEVRREADTVGLLVWMVYRMDTGEFVCTEEMTATESRDLLQPDLFDGVGADDARAAVYLAARRAEDRGVSDDEIDAAFIRAGGLPWGVETIPAANLADAEAAFDGLLPVTP